jgi:hypothetical protein
MKLNWTALLCWCALATSPLWASAQAPTSSSSPLAEMVLSNGTNAAPSLDELVKLKQDPVSGLRQITILATVSPNMPGASGENSVVGLGDTLINFFVSPRKAGALVWGAGPSILLPTQTNPALGSNRPALGPALGLFYPRDSWSAGVILQNGWSFGGSGINRVNAFGAQCLLSYNLPNDWFLSSNATMSANWTVAHHDRWTVPVSGGVGKVLNIGKQSVSVSLQAFVYPVTPRDGPTWSANISWHFCSREAEGQGAMFFGADS